MLSKYTLTGLIALSIAAAPIATPTAMAKDSMDKFLIGIVALGIAGAIANDVKHNKRKQVAHQTPTRKVHKERTHTRRTHNERHRHDGRAHRHSHGDRHHYGDHNQVRKSHHVNRKPRQCLRQRWTDQGWVKFYSKKCLRKHRH